MSRRMARKSIRSVTAHPLVRPFRSGNSKAAAALSELASFTYLQVISTQWLIADYTGPLIRVRRDSDDAEKDFYPDETGWVDIDAIDNWRGNGTPFVVTGYDQSGNSEDVTQATASEQPELIRDGAGTGQHSMYADGSTRLVGPVIYTNARDDICVFATFSYDALPPEDGRVWTITNEAPSAHAILEIDQGTLTLQALGFGGSGGPNHGANSVATIDGDGWHFGMVRLNTPADGDISCGLDADVVTTTGGMAYGTNAFTILPTGSELFDSRGRDMRGHATATIALLGPVTDAEYGQFWRLYGHKIVEQSTR